MLRTTAGLGPYLVVCADCMLAMVYIAILVCACTHFIFTLISPLFSLTRLTVCSHPSWGFVTVSSLVVTSRRSASWRSRCVLYVKSVATVVEENQIHLANTNNIFIFAFEGSQSQLVPSHPTMLQASDSTVLLTKKMLPSCASSQTLSRLH